MTESKPKIFCVRNEVMKSPEEHLTCAYCFARTREAIESGDRKLFCDYHPEKDPVSFGFPEDATRAKHG